MGASQDNDHGARAFKRIATFPVFRNTDVDQVFMEVMRIILSQLSEDFSRAPDEVFEQSRPPPMRVAQS